MAINKIKLKQIDANFPELVGQYGSGYFASTASLNLVSGQCVKYSDISTGRFVYQTGNQGISGIKNFFSRPSISGNGVAMLNEVVTLGGTQTIGGAKTLGGGSLSLDSASVNFTNTSFVFDPFSSSGISKYFIPTGVDALIETNTVGNRYLLFTSNTGIGSNDVKYITGLRVNVFSNTLQAAAMSASSFVGANYGGTNAQFNGILNGNVHGNLSGNALGVLDVSSTTANLLFTSNGNAGYKDLKFNSDLTFNPSNARITATGGFLGSSLRNLPATTSLNIGTNSSTDSINIQFPIAPTPLTRYIFTAGSFTPAQSGQTDLGVTNFRWKNVWSTNGVNNTSDRNLKCEISEIPDEWLDAWEKINYSRFKFKQSVLTDPTGARWHIGIIAQEIQQCFVEKGLNAFEIGMLCYDKWDQSIGPDGDIIPSGEIWSIRPDECQFMELALMRRSINRLKSGISI
jgi:hypothetical protein